MRSKVDLMPCRTSAVVITPPKFSAATAPETRGEPRSVFVAKPTPRASSGSAIGGGRFPKAARLLKHADFDRVYRTGRRQFSASITVFWLRRITEAGSEDQIDRVAENALVTAGPRVGFTVSRVMGGSVVRNRIRRRLREAVRLNLAQLFLPEPQPVDVVINPKKSALTAEFDKLNSEVANAFRAIVKNAASTTGSPAKVQVRSSDRRPR
jgi:ribonuclease P protein component